MSSTSSGDASPASTAEAAHVRRLLEVAGRGPGATRSVTVDLMLSLVERGFRTGVTWYLSPDPGDDPGSVTFSLRLAPEQAHDWRSRQELNGLLAAARRTAGGDHRVELWSSDDRDLRRLVLAGGAGEPLHVIPPAPTSYEGSEEATTRALGAWHARDELPDQPAAIEPEVLAGVVADALAEVAVEVDLSALENVVGDAVRAAVPELGPTPEQVQNAVAEVFGQLVVPTEGPDRETLEAVARQAADRALEIRPSLWPEAGPPGAGPILGGIDPVDIARRVAASVLSPTEIADSLVFRLRPFLDDEADRARRRDAAEADRHRRALEALRLDIEQLADRMDRRLERLEGRSRRGNWSGPADDEPSGASAAPEPTP